MYKRRILIATIGLAACLTVELLYYFKAQEVEEPADSSSSELSIKAQEVEIADSTTESEVSFESLDEISQETEKNEGTEDYMLVPDVEVNVPAETDFGVVIINDVEVSTINTNLQTILDNTGIRHCSFGTTDLTFGDCSFTSGMFGIQKDENDITSFEGTSVSIEVLDTNGNIVSATDLDENLFGEYQVKGIHISDFFTQEDFEVIFYGNIKCGMEEDELINLIGSGYVEEDVFGKTYIYNNGMQTLVVKTEEDVVDEITLLNN